METETPIPLTLIRGAVLAAARPALQPTRDGHLAAFHDASLRNDDPAGPDMTDVAARFAPRNGGYLVADFDLAEIQSLRRLPRLTAGTDHPGFTPSAENPFRMPSFRDVLQLLTDDNAPNGTDIGMDGFFTGFPDLTREVIAANRIHPSRCRPRAFCCWRVRAARSHCSGSVERGLVNAISRPII